MRLLPPLYRRMVDYLRPYLFPYVAVMLVAMLLLSSSEGAIVLIIKRFTNSLTVHRDVSALFFLSLLLLGIFLVRAIASFGADYLEAYVVQKTTLDLRSQLNESLQNQSLSFFNRVPTGVMMSRVVNDVRVVTNNGIDSLFSIFSQGTRLIAVLAGAFYLDWKFALGAFIVFPVAVLPVVRFSKGMRQMTKDAQRQLSGLTVLLQETYQGNRVVKAFGMEDYERGRFNKELQSLNGTLLSAEFLKKRRS